MGGGAPSLPGIVAGDFIAVALSEELEDRKAAPPARNGSSAVAGLAAHSVNSRSEESLRPPATHLAGPLRPQTLLSTAFWRQTKRKGSGEGVEIGDAGWRLGLVAIRVHVVKQLWVCQDLVAAID
jgi:hypothetical protein